MAKRVVLIILDSFGIGASPDASRFGDEGADTLGHIAAALPEWTLPNLQKMGLFNIDGAGHRPAAAHPSGSFARLMERSVGKDTITGHFEIAGLVIERPFPTYPEGFPPELIAKFESAIGTKTLGHMPASGTEIIARLGEEHLRTRYPIIYTSADSVFQIACHEDIYSHEELYRLCRIAREMLTGENGVARVIARPFAGKPGEFYRTSARRDFSIPPPGKTILNLVEESGMEVAAVGKIEDIFAQSGITRKNHAAGNRACIDAVLEYMREDFGGLIFSNLVDFDMLYGHRRNVKGYAEALCTFDADLPEIVAAIRSDDLLMITADHGCDPSFKGTDHTREYVPLLLYGNGIKAGQNLGTQQGFYCIAATIADYLEIPHSFKNSLWECIRKDI